MIPLIAPNFKMWMPHSLHPLIESASCWRRSLPWS